MSKLSEILTNMMETTYVVPIKHWITEQECTRTKSYGPLVTVSSQHTHQMVSQVCTFLSILISYNISQITTL